MAFSGHTTHKLDDWVEPSVSSVNSSQVKTSKEDKPSGGFTFIDFCPQYRRKPDSWFFRSGYQTFSQLFHQINEWLSDNGKWQVKTAETLFYDSTSGFGQSLPFFAGKRVRRNLRAVRLWLVPRLDRSSPQKIGCINVVPRIKITNKYSSNINEEPNDYSIDNKSSESTLLSSAPNYETLDEMLIRVNDLLANKPINGRIINVETVAIGVQSNCWSVDTESLLWSEECDDNRNTLFILRIYFEYGTTQRERLEIIDFVPRVQMWDTPLAVPIYETFSSLLSRSSQWMRDHSKHYRFLSSNTIEAPIDYQFGLNSIKALDNLDNNTIDSRLMFYPGSSQIDNKNWDKFLLKYLRLAVATPATPHSDHNSGSQQPLNGEPLILNCKIFVPTKLPSPLTTNGPDYESISMSKRKIEAWLMTTGARILSAETTVISIGFSSSSIATSVDSCFRSNTSNGLSHYLTIYRIYLNGHYLEPPARLLPLAMNLEDESNENESCTLM